MKASAACVFWALMSGDGGPSLMRWSSLAVESAFPARLIRRRPQAIPFRWRCDRGWGSPRSERGRSARGWPWGELREGWSPLSSARIASPVVAWDGAVGAGLSWQNRGEIGI